MVRRSLRPNTPQRAMHTVGAHTLGLRTTDAAGGSNWAPGRERGRIQGPDNTSMTLPQTTEQV